MMYRLALFLAAFQFGALSLLANPWNGKVVLQGFWWDYWNNNYANNWSTYLSDLAPRLRELGIDAVWIPPTVKNKNATGSVGYAPFDHYDLGDKFQGGNVSTRFGTKDQYLRAVAVLHANGIDVIQDIIFNHMDGAGSDSGEGGSDPAAPSNKFKNFRYVCFATPGTSQTAANYLARAGRFPKNWQNFHPNGDHNTEGDDITAGWFGPDICYYRNATGRSSNATYNPAQAVDYMRNGMRAWAIWCIKQTDVDGFRLDAVKHFETWAAKDFMWSLAYNAGFASGGPHMYAIGEFIGGKDQIDGWVDSVNNSDGFTDVVGAFDVPLRGELKNMVSGSGFYNLGNLPGAQQNRRSRAAPYVNSHDTFRPILASNGNYSSWDTGNELGGHIDPFDPRIQAAYAVIMAVDGSPHVFFEDLFDIGSTGRRYTHRPENKTELPVRDWLANLIWCHQKLNFKDGAYRVRHQAGDLLIIERSSRAIIGVNDHWDSWQSATIQTDFGPNVRLKDYSGANTQEIRTDGSGRVNISVPPCNGVNIRRGYCVWGPVGISGGFDPAARSTTQEWELADDLGDSHPNSLRQGGALPANSIASRTAGRIYPAAGSMVTVTLTPERTGFPLELRLGDSSGAIIQGAAGTGNLTLSHLPRVGNYHTITVANAATTNPTQKVWVRATYTAPALLKAVAPVITAQPQNQFVLPGKPARLAVSATGTPAPTYQWLRGGVAIPGATDPVLDLPSVQSSDTGTYRAEVSNSAAIVLSAEAFVRLTNSVETIATPSWTAQGEFQIVVSQSSGLQYRIDASTNLLEWSPIFTNKAPFTFIQSDARDFPRRFYRVIWLQN